jgi:hypothetical protein
MPKAMQRATCAALAALAFGTALAATPQASGPRAATAAVTPFAARACPAAVADIADCSEGRDANGAWILAVMPRQWNKRLVVHAHGGPRLQAPKAGDSDEGLERFAVMVRAGYAWVGSTYRRGGYGVRMALMDVENSRREAWALWGRPQRTLLHGQSWGGNVAAKLAELQATDAEGRTVYDGVLTTNGLLFGGTRGYGFRADLRAVYQYVCGNHPARGETQYPLWQGLPADARMTRDALRKRVDDCTGIEQPAEKRSAKQAANLRDILAVTGIAERQLVSHLAWATFHFQDLVHKRLGGRNPFDNRATAYAGSRDDAALNAGVQRFSADPEALARLGYDADLTGLIVRPTLAVHAKGDPVVSATALEAYAANVDAMSRGGLLATVLTDEDDHSRMRDATYITALRALEAWLDSGVKPDAAALAATCRRDAADPDECRFIAP